MFCMNCGNKLVEGAKFCPNCGTKIAAMQEENQEKIVLPKTDSAKISGNDQDIGGTAVKEDEGIEDIFLRIFQEKLDEEPFIGPPNIFHGKLEEVFSPQVFFAGKDNIMREGDIRRHYLHGNTTEKLLMVFDGHKKEGFVITDKRIAWDYDQGVREILLEYIKNICLVFDINNKPRHIQLINHDGMEYPLISLKNLISRDITNRLMGLGVNTGMLPCAYRFVAALKKFIYTIQKSDSGDDPNVYFLARICDEMKVYQKYAAKFNREVGNPTIPPSSERYQTAKCILHIPDNEDIFLVQGFLPERILSLNNKKMKLGFALCTTGVYYTPHSERIPRYIPWKEFSSHTVAQHVFYETLYVGSSISNEVYINKERELQLMFGSLLLCFQ